MLFYDARKSKEQKPRPCLALVQDGWMDEKKKKWRSMLVQIKNYVAAKREIKVVRATNQI